MFISSSRDLLDWEFASKDRFSDNKSNTILHSGLKQFVLGKKYGLKILGVVNFPHCELHYLYYAQHC